MRAFLQEAGLAAGSAIGNGRALVGLLPGADLPERLAVPSPTACHTPAEEPARQAQGEEVRQQGAEAAAGRPEPAGVATREDAHAGCRRRRFRSLHPRLLHREWWSALSLILLRRGRGQDHLHNKFPRKAMVSTVVMVVSLVSFPHGARSETRGSSVLFRAYRCIIHR